MADGPQDTSLKGKVVAVLRPRDQAKDFADAIESLGGIPYLVPLIEVRPTGKPEALLRLIRDTATGKVDVVVFMSRNGVLQTLQAAKRIGLLNFLKEALRKIMVVAIGPKTRHELEEVGIRRLTIPDQYSSQGVVKLLEKRDLKGKTVAIPRAQGVDGTLRVILQDLGANVIEAAAYEVTEASDKSLVKKFMEDLVAGKINVVAFTSPSTVKSLINNAERSPFSDEIKDRLRRTLIASIGSTTRRALEELGFKVQVVPTEYTVEALAKEIGSYFQKNTEQSNLENLDELDRKILQLLQYDFPLEVRPWNSLAETLGIDSKVLKSRVKRLFDLKVIRKIGPFPDLKRIGFKTSTLIGVKAPQEKIEKIAETVNRLSNVSHNYLREHKYNLWFTITAKDIQEITETVDILKKKTGLRDEDILDLPVVRTFKTDVRFKLQ
jgi:uroporphyrinogen-III synthase/DNA-binding Lrp family transcriptional regulator